MKRSLLALSLVGAMGIMAVGAEGQAASAGLSQRDHNRQVSTFVNKLSAKQKAQLVDAARGIDRNQDGYAQLSSMDAAAARILTPSQLAQWNLLTDPTATNPGAVVGGTYKKWKCEIDSKVALTFSVIGVIGCPGDTAYAGCYAAFESAVYADQCFISDAETCPDAVDAAMQSAIYWSQLAGSCSLSDVTMRTSGVTYASCGGVVEY